MPHPAPQFLTPNGSPSPPSGAGRSLLITAGPTQEPIDQVRYIGNRSSGRLGIALADHAARAGWSVTLLLGPSPLSPSSSNVNVKRFRTTADLEQLLAAEFPHADVLIMAAAVADFRPAPSSTSAGKLRRSAGPLTLTLEPTPDLLAACGRTRRQGQYIIGFALEPEDRLEQSAQDKLARKGADMIVANPLETMDAPTIRATLVRKDLPPLRTPGSISKDGFAAWLLEELARSLASRAAGQ